MSAAVRDRIGILDIGTLSLRFDIFALSPLNLQPLGSYRLIHRAGEFDLADNSQAVVIRERLSNAFDEIRRLADTHGVDRIVGGVTGLFRSCDRLSREIIQAAAQRGISLRILSGDEELRLIASAVIRFFSDLPRESLLVDIGGGSSEISLVRDKQLVCGESVPIGVLVAKRLFPPVDGGRYDLVAIEQMRQRIKEMFLEVHKRFSALTDVAPDIVIGSSGSARELERVLKLVGKEFSLLSLEEFFSGINGKSVDELTSEDGVDPKRADLLVPGTLIFIEAMRAFSLARAKVSHYSLRHGILAAEMVGTF